VQKIGVSTRERGLAAFVLAMESDASPANSISPRCAGQIPFAPGRDDLDVGLERVIGKLEADLIVALAVAPWATALGARLFGVSICFLAMRGRAIEVPSR